MPRLIRVQHPDSIYLITNRCLHSRFLFAPGQSNLLSHTILQLLAASQARFNVHIFAFVFLSNHFHLIVRAPLMNLSQFMCHFQTQLAKFINHLRGRSGTVFPTRFDAQYIVDDPALLSTTLYLLANPTRANLVTHPDQWPSLISHHTYRNGHSPFDTLPLTPLPCFPDLQTQQRALSPLLDDHCDQLVRRARQLRKPFLGPRNVRRTSWRDQPSGYTPERAAPRTLDDRVMGQDPARRRFVDHLRAVFDAYHAARVPFRGAPFEQFCQAAGLPDGTHHPRTSWCVGGAVGVVG